MGQQEGRLSLQQPGQPNRTLLVNHPAHGRQQRACDSVTAAFEHGTHDRWIILRPAASPNDRPHGPRSAASVRIEQIARRGQLAVVAEHDEDILRFEPEVSVWIGYRVPFPHYRYDG